MKDLLVEAGADSVKIFGGGGGVIVHDEKKELEDYGIDFIFHPDDGRKMGLEGMIQLIMEKCDYSFQESVSDSKKMDQVLKGHENIPHRLLGIALDAIERLQQRLERPDQMDPLPARVPRRAGRRDLSVGG